MKVFVYSKKTSKRIAIITNVVCVQSFVIVGKINILDGEGNSYTFDTKDVKTSTFQN